MRRFTILIVLLGLGYLASPYWSVYRLAHGVRDSDQEILETYVDWSTLRQNVKEELAAVLAGNMATEMKEEDMLATAFATAIGPMIFNNMIDTYLNAASVTRLIKEKQSGADNKDARGDFVPPVDAETLNSPLDAITWAFFDGPRSFAVKIEGKDQSDGQLKLIFRPHGLVWKLEDFVLPAVFHQDR